MRTAAPSPFHITDPIQEIARMFHSRPASRLRRLAIRCLLAAAAFGCASAAQAAPQGA